LLSLAGTWRETEQESSAPDLLYWQSTVRTPTHPFLVWLSVQESILRGELLQKVAFFRFVALFAGNSWTKLDANVGSLTLRGAAKKISERYRLADFEF
jgi:hypothetical protein